MLSVIICSVNPARLQQLTQNIHETIGVEHEIIAFDNREEGRSIAKVYNDMARKARYPYLLFVHEDVKLHTPGWGNVLEEKLYEPSCGVLGVAGSLYKSPLYSGWYQVKEWVVSYHIQRFGKESKMMACNITENLPYKEVVTLDGMALSVRKEVWEKHPFDEKELPGFHCYDLDFTLQLVHQGYKNYVCCSPRFILEHYSPGHYSDEWFSTTIRLHDGKWKSWLPLATQSYRPLPPALQQKAEEKIAYVFLFHILRSNSPEKKRILKAFHERPFSWKHLIHCMTCTFKYWRTL